MSGADEPDVMSARMRAAVIRRRGEKGAYVPPAEPLAVYLERQRDDLPRTEDFHRRAVASTGSAPDLAAAAREPGYGDPATMTPVQAALQAARGLGVPGTPQADCGYVESWVAGRGPAFAVRALAEFFDLSVGTGSPRSAHPGPRYVRGTDERMRYSAPQEWRMARRLLALLAGAPDPEYQEADQAAEPYRSGTRVQQALTAFLFREHRERVSQAINELIPPGTHSMDLTCFLLASAITDATQAVEYQARQRWWSWPEDLGALASLLDAAGPAVTPLLLDWLDNGAHYEDSRPRLLAVIAELGSSDSISALIARIAEKGGQQAVLAAGERSPRLTVRLLAEADPASSGARVDGDAEAWSLHVRKALIYVANHHRAAARAALPDLGPAARQRLEAVLEPRRALRQMPWAEVPEILVTPPWLDRGAAPKPVVIKGLTPPGAARSPEIATFAADLFSRVKSRRTAASDWLAAHAAHAAEQLIPAAVGKPGKARDTAARALRWLAAHTGTDVTAIAVAAYGDEAAIVIKALISDDGLRDLPKSMPALPVWAEPYALPQLARGGGRSALPPKAVRYVVQMLSISTPDAPYPGVALIRDGLNYEARREFAWALFENWQLAGHPADQAWAFDALRWFGDAEIVPRLEPLIRAWPGDSAHARAVTGLDVLAAIGGDAALRAVYRISQKLKFKALKDRAAEQIEEIAGRLGLTAEQLGDQLVPDLGLDPDGTLTLDYGPRRFVVGFDELLRPFVRDASGKRLKTLPKPAATDDAALAAAAAETFAALKKDAQTVAVEQIARLELAMCTRRRWSMLDFCSYFVAHPLVGHIVRRLVWGTYDAGGNLVATFRIAEDLMFVDVDDALFEGEGDPFEAGIDTVIGLPHPVEFSALIPRWSDTFADYEILQPFAQLGREAYALTEAERMASNLERFRGTDIPVERLLGLTGGPVWRRGRPRDGGVEEYLTRALPGGRALVVGIEPGIDAASAADSGDQRLTALWILRDGRVGLWSARLRAPLSDRLGTLDPVTASEILRDLTEVTAP